MKGVVIPTAIAALALAGCAGVEVDRDDDDFEPPAGAVVVPTERVVYETYSGFEQPRRTVIRTEAEWEDFWTRLHENVTPRPARPEIDFRNEVIVAAAMGTRATGGYAIEIEQVHQTATGLVAVVVETEPAEDCIVTQAVTSPVHVIRVPITGQAVSFVERDRVRPC